MFQHFYPSKSEIEKYSIKKLKSHLASIGIDYSSCIERNDLVLLLTGVYFKDHAETASTDEVEADTDGKPAKIDLCIQGSNISILQGNLETNFQTGPKVWNSGFVLAEFLEWSQSCASAVSPMDGPCVDLRGKTVVELGCGAGLIGLVASFLGAGKVIMTDLEDCLGLAQQNVDDNSCNLAAAGLCIPELLPLEWGNEKHFLEMPCQIDFVLASDVVYKEDLFHPLMATFDKLSASRQPTIILAYKRRNSCEEWFFSLLRHSHFTILKMDFPNNQNVQIFLLQKQVKTVPDIISY